LADTNAVQQPRVNATPYAIGSSVSSVELLLDARTAAEGCAPLVSQQLAASTRIDSPVEVWDVVPGPLVVGDDLQFVAEAQSGALGTLSISPTALVMFVDLIMGGRGIGEDRGPSRLELDLFTARFVEPVGTILDALAPGRPAPVALVHRELPLPPRSLVVTFRSEHREVPVSFKVEVLAHHLADDTAEADFQTMEHVCGDVALDISFTFSPVALTTSEVAALSVGDVICLDHAADQPIVGEVDGLPMVHGRVGTSRQRVAVEVVDLIERNNEHG
jgi:hypothetical protein